MSGSAADVTLLCRWCGQAVVEYRYVRDEWVHANGAFYCDGGSGKRAEATTWKDRREICTWCGKQIRQGEGTGFADWVHVNGKFLCFGMDGIAVGSKLKIASPPRWSDALGVDEEDYW